MSALAKPAEKFADRDRQIASLHGYYRLHARIYDATRWTFLFGRGAVLDLIRQHLPGPASTPSILEVGCGTGKNLEALARSYPRARLTGIDLSADMLAKARAKLRFCEDRISLVQEPYAAGCAAGTGFDLVLFSYSLTMINPQWAEVLDQARSDLRVGGLVASVDFHDSPFTLFRKHMALNHVRVEGHLLPALRARFKPVADQVRPAYGGIWSYYLFLGRKV